MTQQSGPIKPINFFPSNNTTPSVSLIIIIVQKTEFLACKQETIGARRVGM